MKIFSMAVFAVVFVALCAGAFGEDSVQIGLPGFQPSRMEASGKLVEDWGSVAFVLSGEGIPAEGAGSVQRVVLDGIIPAAQARIQRGPLVLTLTAFRAPAWPSGFDVLTVRVEETSGHQRKATLAVELPDGAIVGRQSVRIGGRTVLSLLEPPTVKQEKRDWGYDDEAQSLPGWGTPEVECDPAFRNIRAGLGGVPIFYHFAVEKGGSAQVVLGLMESFHATSGQRIQVCKVEGAQPVEVDPIARWGRNRPGVLVFNARDENNDGFLDVSILPAAHSPDQNPILNVLWIFPPNIGLNPEQVIAGRMNQAALRYVDVGGQRDQSIYLSGRLEYELDIPVKGFKELNFFVASPGASVPLPERTAWTVASLRKAAREVLSAGAAKER